MSGYTPGPWQFNLNIISAENEVLAAGGWPICVTDGSTEEEAEANALLIAAAPELLEALEAVLVAWQPWIRARDEAQDSTERKARDVIRKARRQ
jgi:hypothetical protein